jgi:hypothetical protein
VPSCCFEILTPLSVGCVGHSQNIVTALRCYNTATANRIPKSTPFCLIASTSSLHKIQLTMASSASSQSENSKRSIDIDTSTILAQDEHPTNTPCDISCLNGGSCTFIEYFDYPIPGQNGYYMGCQCPQSFRGGQCEIIQRGGNGKMIVGVVMSLTLVLLVGMAYRRKRQRSARWNDRLNSVYMDNLARDLGNLAHRENECDDDEGSLEEVEFDRRDTRESLESVEDRAVGAEYL